MELFSHPVPSRANSELLSTQAVSFIENLRADLF